MRFSELRQKEVINICDGRKLGSVADMEIDCVCGTILSLIVPNAFSLASLFKEEPSGCVIPWGAVLKIGDDAILVQADHLVTT